MFNFTENTQKVINILIENNLTPIFVGGFVRDALISNIHGLKIKNKDIDIEVFGETNMDKLKEILEPLGKVIIAGKSFGVLKLWIENEDFDISLPRKEKNKGIRHKDLVVDIDPKISFKEAFKRRDLTINAIGFNIKENVFIDEFNGINDIKTKTIKVVDNNTFIEDPLRLLRAIGFAVRFNFKIEEKSKILLKSMVDKNMLSNILKERIFTEWKKFLLKSEKPSKAIMIMKEIGLLEKNFSEISNLINIKQDPKWHPEGDVFVHTLMVLNEMSKLLKESKLNENDKVALLFAAITHDFGKVKTTKLINGKITSHNHEREGVEIAKNFMKKITNEKDVIEKVLLLTEFHLFPLIAIDGKIKLSTFKKIHKKIDLELLAIMAVADKKGRGFEFDGKPLMKMMLSKKEEIENIEKNKDKLSISGKDLINHGLKPSKVFSILLEELNDIFDPEQDNKDEVIKTFLTARKLI